MTNEQAAVLLHQISARIQGATYNVVGKLKATDRMTGTEAWDLLSDFDTLRNDLEKQVLWLTGRSMP